MEPLFDEAIAQRYDRWYLSPAGRYVERVENELLLDLLRPRRGQSVLDVGCGTGNHLLLFHQMGLDVTGIDPSEPMLKVARDKLGPGADLRLGGAEDLPFDDNSFDIVTLVTSLEFCEHPFRALAEASRVARAQLFIGVLNRLSANGIHRKVEGLFCPTLFRHARFYSILELRYMLRRVLGVCRMNWGSVIWLPLRFHAWDGAMARWIPRRRNPFGAFLAMRVDILYTHQAVLNPLTSPWLAARRREAVQGTVAGMGLVQRSEVRGSRCASPQRRCAS
jgi:ubiquinone/menaquinone biosynthesis C-methylase UbiE